MQHKSARLQRFAFVTALLWSVSWPAIAACPVQSDELERALKSAEAAARELDPDLFHLVAAATEADVSCVASALPAEDVPRYLRILGLRAYMDKDLDRAAQAFAAARALEPSQDFLHDVLPEDNPFWATYRKLDVADGTYVEIPPASAGTVLLDGRPGTSRPVSWPTLFQYLGPDGVPAKTVLLWPADPMPAYPHKALVTPGGHASRTLLITAGASALAGAGSYAAAAVSRGDFNDATTEEAVNRSYGRTNAFVFTSVGLGVAGVGLGVAAVAVGRW